MQARKSHLLVSVLAGLFLFLAASTSWAHCDGKHTGNHPHCTGGGGGGEDEPPALTVESNDPFIQLINSSSVDKNTVAVFSNAQIDLAQFAGTHDSGGSCDHGLSTGHLVIRPKYKDNFTVALLRLWFTSELESGEEVTHLFQMEGVFDEPDNWVPSVANPVTTVTFNYWDVMAENRKAQRQDCAGESDIAPDPNGSWTVTVIRQP